MVPGPRAAGVRQSVLACMVVLAAVLLAPAPPATAVPPELPRVLIDTTYVTPTGATITVPAGGNFQAALNNAQPGDVITLAAGATYQGPFTLPNKSGSGWITVRTSAPDTSLPAPGTRVTPAFAAVMPKLTVGTGVGGAIQVAPGAHHFRFVGIEFKPVAGASVWGLLELGTAGETSDAAYPHHVIVDRCYVHGNPGEESIRGVALNGKFLAVVDSYLADFKSDFFDTQAIMGWSGPGPFKIVNNYLESAGENVMFGGGDPSMVNVVPSDIEIRHNYFFKPLTFRGTWDAVKNIFELKNARRVLVEGNILENIWLAAQAGYAVQFTVRNQDGTAPWSTIEDVTFRKNLVRHAGSGVNILGTDDPNPSQTMARVVIRDNVFEDVNSTTWGGLGKLYQILDYTRGTTDVVIEHNTGFQDGSLMYAEGVGQHAFVFRNNVAPRGVNGFGVIGNGVAEGVNTLNTYFPSIDFHRNVIVGANAAIYPADNFFPSSLNAVGFVNLAGGNYRLAATSPYKSAATDGTDVGADIDALEAATAGVIAGVMGSTDAVPPSAAMTAPAVGATVSGASVTVSATASDNVGVASVQFRLDGAALGAPVAVPPYSIVWNTTATANGAHTLTAQATDLSGNTGTSAGVSVTVANTSPVPVLTSHAPAGATAGGAGFTLTVTGSGFVPGSTVRWDGAARTTTFVSATQLTAAIPGADIGAQGTAAITVFTPAPGGGTSGSRTFTINAPAPTLTSLAPSAATVGATALTLTVTGTGFVPASEVRWNGAARTTTFVSATQLTAAIAAADVATQGTASVTVFTPAPGGGTSGSRTFTINAPAPTLASLAPSSALAGSGALTLTVTGTGFVPASQVRWSGAARTTTFVSATQLTSAITAADVAAQGTASVTVFTGTPGGGTSGARTFTISAPAPTLTSLAPSSALAGSGALTLTVTGTGFVPASQVQWNGGTRTTTFVSATQLTAAILAADVAAAGTASVTVFTGTPGGGTSSAQTFTIGAPSNPVPTLTSLSPSSATAGAAGFTLTATGTSFITGSVIQWGGAARTTTFVSSTQLTAAIPAADVATAGAEAVTVFSPPPGGGTSSAVNFTTNNPAPTLTSVSPSSVTAGAAAFTLTVTGTSFVTGSTVRWNGAARTTTFVSATQLTAAILAADVAAAGTASVTVVTGAPGGGTSSAVTFTINAPPNPMPTLTSLSPSSVTAGAPAFTLTLTGTSFVAGSTVRWNGAARPTTFVGATQLAAAITAADVAAAGTASVTVFTATPGGGTSSAVTFTINAPPNPMPTLTSLSPSSVTVGAPAFTLTVTGTSFVTGSTVRWNGAARTTTFVSATQLTAAITAADVAAAGTASVTVFTATPGGGTSSAVTLTIEGSGPPAGATLIAPSGSLSNGTPTYTWNAVPGATQYLLWVDDSSGGRIRTTYAAAQVGCPSGTGTCSVTPGVALSPGSGIWYVVTSNTAGSGPWSSGMTFTVAGTPPPGAATQIAPSGTATLTPTYTWNAVATATQYMLWVDDSTGGRIRTWYTAAQAGCASGTGVCSLNTGVILSQGAGQWWVITANASGSGPWSAGMTFTVPLLPPGQATLLAPTGSIPGTGAVPTFTWSAVPGATQYLLWLDDSSGGRARTWYSAAQANCAGGAGTCSISPGILLNPGAGQWWIVTNNTAGDGPWSNGMTFTVAGTPPPGAATLVGPSGLTTSTPTFRWNAVAGATQYLLWMDDSSGGRVRTWYTAEQAGCGSGAGVCSIAPGLVLTSGAGQFWVITGNATGQGPWSASMSFIVP